MLPHPTLLGDPAFPHLAQRYDYTQINFEESRLLPGAVHDPAINARRLSFLVGEEKAIAVSNGAGRGWLWLHGRWLAIDPPAVDVVDETGCGDSFAAALVVGWRLLGLGVEGECATPSGPRRRPRPRWG